MNTMTNKRYRQLDINPTEFLTEDEKKEGWHRCPEWDGLVIHAEWPEAECCTCNPVTTKELT